MLNEVNYITDELLSAKAEDLHEILNTPTLFHLEGIRPQPLFISTLLHGNETTGLYAVQQLLKKYREQPLPRAISLFVGNIAAAREKQRHLDDQDDYNRIWPGTDHRDSVEKDMMQAVTRIMRKKKPFASIDIHNNTGRNPHYACINILNPHGLVLASMFSDIAVYFTSPKGVQSSAFSDFCPSIVLECGQSGDESGVDHALTYLEKILEMEDFSPQGNNGLKLYHTVARVTIPQAVSIGDTVKDGSYDLILNADLEDKNFHCIEVGATFALVNPEVEKHICVSSESNEDIAGEYFELKDNRLLFKKPAILSMFTVSEKAIRQDCVCYLMEELRVG